MELFEYTKGPDNLQTAEITEHAIFIAHADFSRNGTTILKISIEDYKFIEKK